MTAPAAAKKNKYGNRVYPVPNDAGDLIELPSVTYLLKTLAAPGLEIWKQKQLAEQFSLRPDLVMLAGNPDTRWQAIQDALSFKGKANSGTAVHYYTESVDDGTLDWNLVPAPAKPWVEHYAEAKERYGWKLVDKEFTVYNHEAGYAGSADRILDVPGYGLAIADVKTSANVYPDYALQMSFYANGEGIWTPPRDNDVQSAIQHMQDELDAQVASGVKPDGKKMTKVYENARQEEIEEARWEAFAKLGHKTKLPEDLRRDIAFIIHVTETGCELIPMGLAGTYDAIRGICAVNRFTSRKGVIQKFLAPEPTLVVPSTRVATEPIEPESKEIDEFVPTGTTALSSEPTPQDYYASLRTRMLRMQREDIEKVVFSWPSGVPGLKTFDHTPEQLGAIDRVVSERETAIHATEQENADLGIVQNAFPGGVVLDENEPF